MKNLKKLLQLFLVKAYGLTEDEAAALLNKAEDGTDKGDDYVDDKLTDKLLDLDKAKVAKLKGKDGEENENFKQGYNKAKKETLSKFEKDIADEYEFENDAKLTGIELVKAIVTTKAKPTTANAKDITEDVIKAHPTYIALEKANAKAIKDSDKKVVDEVNKVRAEFAQKETASKVKDVALAKLLELKPVLPKDAKLAKNQTELFVNRYLTGDYEQQADGRFLAFTGTGDQRKRVEDEHGHPVYLDDQIKTDVASFFEIQKQDDKGSAGNGGGAGAGGGGGAGAFQFTLPKNEADYNTAIFNANSPEERAAIKEAYDAANAGS